MLLCAQLPSPVEELSTNARKKGCCAAPSHMEDPVGSQRTICREVPALCGTWPLRIQGEDSKRHVSVRSTINSFLCKSFNIEVRTLATDRGFKERVREDMLVRLLDAFVWRNQGEFSIMLFFRLMLILCSEQQELAETHNLQPPLSFTYVQGMNVLAAPFLYTMPSEMEAFFCFSRFIERSCPLYVQQTLEGVHRGLKVQYAFACCATLPVAHPDYDSSWTDASK